MPLAAKKQAAKKAARRKSTVVAQDPRRRLDILYAWVFACAYRRLFLSEPKNLGPSQSAGGAIAGLTPYAACAMVAYWPSFRVDAEDEGSNSVWTFTMLDPGLRKGPSIQATIGMPSADFTDYVARAEAHWAVGKKRGQFSNLVDRIDFSRKTFEEAEAKEAAARKLAERKALKRAGAGRDSLQHQAELLVRNGKEFENRRDAGFEQAPVRSSREASMRLLRKPEVFVEKISNGGARNRDGLVWWVVELGFVEHPERDVTITCYAPPIESLLEPRALQEAARKSTTPSRTSKKQTDTQ